MGTIFGRDGELERIAAVLRSSKEGGLARAIRIAGPSGMGKTTIAVTAAERARGGGWLVAQAQGFRLHESLPLFMARRLARALVAALGDQAERYRSGLDLEAQKPDVFELAFIAFIEALTLDHPALLLVDDAQWTDQESRELIVRAVSTLADRALVVVSTERTDEGSEAAFALRDEAIAVGTLPRNAAEGIVRSIFPDANADVVASIISGAGARAVDLVAVAESARNATAATAKDVNASMRSVISRELALLDAPVREFLQVCSLIEEPIDLSLLHELWPQEQLLQLIGSLSGQYLVEGDDGLRFVHASIMDSIQETIAIELPYRYRIIEALKRLPSPRLEDLERLAQQAGLARDHALQRETLLAIAQKALQESLHSLTADATERALRIAPPQGAEIVSFYTQLSQVYNVLGREGDCVLACREALDAAARAGIDEGLSGIVASMILALWHMGHYAEARAEYDKYDIIFTKDRDRAELLSVGAFIRMNDGDFEAVRQMIIDFSRVKASAGAFVLLRSIVAEAFAALRLGDEARGLSLATEAERVAQQLPPLAMTMPRSVRMMHAILYGGVRAAEKSISERKGELNTVLTDVLLGVAHLARGQFDDLRELVSDRLVRRRGTATQRVLLASYAVAAAFDEAQRTGGLWPRVLDEVHVYQAGDRGTALLPIVAAWLVADTSVQGPQAEALLGELIDLHARPLDTVVFSYPVLLVLAAKRLRAREAIRRLAAPDALFADRHPWSQAQHLLARGCALSELGEKDAASVLASARERFEILGMSYFAEYAQTITRVTPAAPAVPPNKTTRREREVAALVADGLTNREIAERLVLSERTVEGHIANLFGKIDVSSRTQLAAWYLRTSSSVA